MHDSIVESFGGGAPKAVSKAYHAGSLFIGVGKNYTKNASLHAKKEDWG